MNKMFILRLLSAGLLIGAFSRAAAQTETLKCDPQCQPANARAVVSIAADGDRSLGGKKVEKTNLTSELVNYICEKLPEDRIVYIRATAATPYGQITEIARLWRQLDVDQAVLMLDAQSSGLDVEEY